MKSGGETKELRGYTVIPDGPTSNWGTIVDGKPDKVDGVSWQDYQGWATGKCNTFSETAEITGIRLTPKIAAAFMKKFELTPHQFHINAEAEKPGSFCLTTTSSVKRQMIWDGFDCSMVEGLPPEFVSWEGRSACEAMKKNLNPEYKTGSDQAKDFWNGLNFWSIGAFIVGGVLTLGLTVYVGGTLAGYTFFRGGHLFQNRNLRGIAEQSVKLREEELKLRRELEEAKRKAGGKDDDLDPPSGGSGVVDEVPAEEPATLSATAKVKRALGMPVASMDMLAGAQTYLSDPAVQADLVGMQTATVVEVPFGVRVPDGSIVVQVNNGLYFMPTSTIAMPSVNIGSVFEVPAFRLAPVRVLVAP